MGDDNPVLIYKRNNIRRRSKGNEIKMSIDHLHVQIQQTSDSRGELKRDAPATQSLERIRTTTLFWVENSEGIRKSIIGCMMISDDDAYTCFVGVINRLQGVDAAVASDQELSIILPGKIYTVP